MSGEAQQVFKEYEETLENIISNMLLNLQRTCYYLNIVLSVKRAKNYILYLILLSFRNKEIFRLGSLNIQFMSLKDINISALLAMLMWMNDFCIILYERRHGTMEFRLLLCQITIGVGPTGFCSCSMQCSNVFRHYDTYVKDNFLDIR